MTNPSQPDQEPRYEYPARTTPRKSLRASDQDREHIAGHLRHAAAEGRLRVEELEQRLATAFSAMTYGELDAVVSDLPLPRPAAHSRAVASVRRRPARALIAIAAAMAALLAGAVGLRHNEAAVASAQPRFERFRPPPPEAPAILVRPGTARHPKPSP